MKLFLERIFLNEVCPLLYIRTTERILLLILPALHTINHAKNSAKNLSRFVYIWIAHRFPSQTQNGELGTYKILGMLLDPRPNIPNSHVVDLFVPTKEDQRQVSGALSDDLCLPRKKETLTLTHRKD